MQGRQGIYGDSSNQTQATESGPSGGLFLTAGQIHLSPARHHLRQACNSVVCFGIESEDGCKLLRFSISHISATVLDLG